jgi:hypothetical protein
MICLQSLSIINLEVELEIEQVESGLGSSRWGWINLILQKKSDWIGLVLDHVRSFYMLTFLDFRLIFNWIESHFISD